MLTASDLEHHFRRPTSTIERIGIELECGLVDAESGLSIQYHGRNGASAFLETVRAEFEAEPAVEHGNLLGVIFQNGALLSLEAGGALEYSSAPDQCLNEVVSLTRSEIENLSEIARHLNIAILPGGMLPFTGVDDIPWLPKPRLQVMRDYFARLGEGGSLADRVMGLTLSAQITLDYISAADWAAKLGMLVAVSPIMAALFANSPIEAGRLAGAESRRIQCWQKIDPRRCGVLPFAVGRDFAISDFIEWAMTLPMIYRLVNQVHVAAPNAPFGELMCNGFGRGDPVTLADWECHLDQLWPHVRVRRTLEMRIADGPTWPDFGAVAAMWTGLAYHRPSLNDAWNLLRGYTIDELDFTTRQIAVRGLGAKLGTHSVQELAQELLRLAEIGLGARIKANVEPSSAMHLLDPVREIVTSGVSAARTCANRWLTDLGESPTRYVDTYQVRPS